MFKYNISLSQMLRSVAYLGPSPHFIRPWPPPSERPKIFLTRYTVKCTVKWNFKPIYFAQKCPQNAGNAISETQISKHFWGSMSPNPTRIVSSLWPPPH